MAKLEKKDDIINLSNINGSYIHYKAHDDVKKASLNFSMIGVVEGIFCSPNENNSELILGKHFIIEGFEIESGSFFEIKSITVGHQRVMIKVKESDDLTIFADDCKEIQEYLALCVSNNIYMGHFTEVGTIKYTPRNL